MNTMFMTLDKMKKNLIYFISISLFTLTSNAQTLEVKSLECEVMDLSGSTHPRKDLNGKDCALLKIEAPGIDLHFQGNIIGDVEKKASEYWCYLTEGTLKLKILSDNYESIFLDFRDSGIDGLLGKHTYVLKIICSAPLGQDFPSPKVKTFNVKGVKFQMTKIDGGSYVMGATKKQIDEFGKENLRKYYPHLNSKHHYGSGFHRGESQHNVVLDDYYIGTTEVTQELWQAVMGKNPSSNKEMSLPVTDVTWHDCQKFIKKLNKILGTSFRLPTEAEWEYAARGGKESRNYVFCGSDDLGEVAWCYGNCVISGRLCAHSVGMKKANELGIFDMSGNVREWCSDWYSSYFTSERNPKGPDSGSYKVVRGGEYSDSYPKDLFPFSRDSNFPDWSDSHTGFRLALSSE